MKKLTTVLAVVIAGALVLIPASPVLAAFAAGQWLKYCTIETGDISRGYALTEITGPLYQGAARDFRDIRVIGTAGNKTEEVPYDIVTVSALPQTIKLPAAMINRGISDKKSTATVDLGKKVRHNNLNINTRSRDFIKEVTVEASEDGTSWLKVKSSGKIADFTSTGQLFHQTHVAYDPVDYRYLRVTLDGGSGKAVEIDGIEILFTDDKSGAEKNLEMEIVSQGQSKKDNTTEIVVTGGFNNFPIHSLNFAVDNTNFNRAAVIFGSNDRKEWEQVGDGQLVSFNLSGYTDVQLNVRINHTGYRFLKAVIHNGDSAPLRVLGVKGRYFPGYILFPCQTGREYRVYFGNQSAVAPAYDISAFSSRILSTNPPEWKLSAPRANPEYKTPLPPESERQKWLLPSVLAILIAGLAVFIIKLVPKVMKGE